MADPTPTNVFALAAVVFPNSRPLTAEERRDFNALFWPTLEPIEIADEPTTEEPHE